MLKQRHGLALLTTIVLLIGGCAGLNEIVQEPQVRFKNVVPTDSVSYTHLRAHETS